jgi:23S rRNA pseudouridine1911/1915/1917 synthase
MYGGRQAVKGPGFSTYKAFLENAFQLCPRQALHAKTLGFKHPVSGEWMQFDSELPSDMQAVIAKWRAYNP